MGIINSELVISILKFVNETYFRNKFDALI
jgi:hypothetical protein